MSEYQPALSSSDRDQARVPKQSWQRISRTRWATIGVSILFLTSFSIWQSPLGQRWRMQRELAGLRREISDESRREAAIALAKVGDQQQALDVVASINTPSSKVEALRAVAAAYTNLNAPELAKPLLEQAHLITEHIDYLHTKAVLPVRSDLNTPELARSLPVKPLLERLKARAEQVDDPDSRAIVLRTVFTASYVFAPKPDRSALEQSLTSAERIDDPYSRAIVLNVIAKVYIDLNAPELAKPLLEQSQISAEQIDHLDNRVFALSAIAETYADLEDWRQVNRTAALCTSNDCKANVLSVGLTVRAEQLHPELKKQEEEE